MGSKAWAASGFWLPRLKPGSEDEGQGTGVRPCWPGLTGDWPGSGRVVVRVSGSLTVASYCHRVTGVRWRMCPGAAFPPWRLSLGGAGTVCPHLVPGWEKTLALSDKRSEVLCVVGWFGDNVAVSGPGPRPVPGALSPASPLSPGHLGLVAPLLARRCPSSADPLRFSARGPGVDHFLLWHHIISQPILGSGDRTGLPEELTTWPWQPGPDALSPSLLVPEVHAVRHQV